MEGELLIKVIGASNLFKKEGKGDPNPYCKIIFGKEVIANTKILNSTCNPLWNESFRIPVKKRTDYLEIKMYSKDKKKKPLGVCILTIEEIEGNKESEREYTLQKKEKKQNVSGTIRLKLIYTPRIQNQNTIQMQILDVQDSKPLKRRSYVKVKYGAQKLKTILTEPGSNPTWNETFSISLWGPNKLNVLFVKENKSVVGQAKIDLRDYKSKFGKEILVPLKKRKEQIGNLRIKLIYKGDLLDTFEDSLNYSNELSSSIDISMDSESESEVTQLETSISDSGEATSFGNSESEKVTFGDAFIHIRDVKIINPKYKQEFYFICSSKSDYVSSPKVLEEDIIRWDEIFFAELYSMDAPLIIKFYNRKSPNCIGRLVFNFNEFNESPIDGWYELEGKSEDCCLHKVNIKIEYFSNIEFYDSLLATDYILDANIVRLNNVRKNHPFYIKSTVLGSDISAKTNSFRGNDTNLVVDESLSLTLKKNSKIIEFSVYTTYKKEEKLLGKVFFHLGYLNEKNNYFCSHLFTLQKQSSKLDPSDTSIRLRLKLTRSSDHLLFRRQNRKDDFDNIDLNISLIIVGPSGSGKTSLLYRFLDDQFVKNTTVTITDDKRVFYDVEDKCVSVVIKDTAGMERFSDIIVKTFYRNADGVLLVFDKTEENHLERIKTYFHNIQEYCPKAKVILLGSKCEDLDRIAISSNEIQSLISEYKVKYMDVSAKDNINVSYVFHNLLEEIYQYKKDQPIQNLVEDVHTITEIPKKSKKCKCTIS